MCAKRIPMKMSSVRSLLAVIAIVAFVSEIGAQRGGKPRLADAKKKALADEEERTEMPTEMPTTHSPSPSPSHTPTEHPTATPSAPPTDVPTATPSAPPTDVPTASTGASRGGGQQEPPYFMCVSTGSSTNPYTQCGGSNWKISLVTGNLLCYSVAASGEGQTCGGDSQPCGDEQDLANQRGTCCACKKLARAYADPDELAGVLPNRCICHSTCSFNTWTNEWPATEDCTPCNAQSIGESHVNLDAECGAATLLPESDDLELLQKSKTKTDDLLSLMADVATSASSTKDSVGWACW